MQREDRRENKKGKYEREKGQSKEVGGGRRGGSNTSEEEQMNPGEQEREKGGKFRRMENVI